jgi:hypothetical protein
LARSEQEAINRLLSAVGDADDATANAMVAAGGKYGFVEAGPPKDLGSLMVPVAQRPGDQGAESARSGGRGRAGGHS